MFESCRVHHNINTLEEAHNLLFRYCPISVRCDVDTGRLSNPLTRCGHHSSTASPASFAAKA
jgi:hypothetical protein